MLTVADVRITPWTSADGGRKELARALEILRRTGLPLRVHAHGTNIEGDYATIVNAVRSIHEVLHAEGIVRVTTTLVLSSRIDRRDSIQHRLVALGESPAEHEAMDSPVDGVRGSGRLRSLDRANGVSRRSAREPSKSRTLNEKGERR